MPTDSSRLPKTAHVAIVHQRIINGPCGFITKEIEMAHEGCSISRRKEKTLVPLSRFSFKEAKLPAFTSSASHANC